MNDVGVHPAEDFAFGSLVCCCCDCDCDCRGDLWPDGVGGIEMSSDSCLSSIFETEI